MKEIEERVRWIILVLGTSFKTSIECYLDLSSKVTITNK